MTKTQLKEFVEQKRSSALFKADEFKADEINDLRKKISDETGLTEILERISESATGFKTELDVFNEKNKKRIQLSGDWSSTLLTMISIMSTSSEKLVSYVFEHDAYGSNVPELIRLKKKHDDIRININSQYNSIIANIVKLSTAKKASEYLKELGFDIPNEKESKCTALMTPIDKKYLFLC